MDNENLNLTPDTEENKPQETEQQKDFEFLGDPTLNNTNKTQKSSKLKKFVPLIALGVVAVVLLTAVLVLPKLLPDTQQEPKDDEETVEIFNFTGTSAERLEIDNQIDKYAFIRKLEKTYYIEGNENAAVSNSTILSLLTYFGSLEAVTVVDENVTDFEQFGLDKPVSTATWIKGETKHTLEIGDIAASGNYYARVDGTSTVYTIKSEVAVMFCSPRMDFYDSYIYDFDQETDANYINYFEITRKGEKTIKIRLQDLTDETIDSAYVMETPIVHNMSVEKSNELTDIVANMTSCTVYDDDVTDAGLKKYGLDDPYIKFTFVNVAQEYKFRISEPTDKGYSYMFVEGREFIYIVDEDTIEILTYDTADYLDSMAYSRSYDTIDNIVIKGGGKTYEIDITGTSEDSDLKAYINNKFVQYENFADFYSHIIGIEIKDLQDGMSTNDRIVTVTVNCIDGSVDTLEYFRQSDLNSFYRLNGKGNIVVSTAKAEQILEFAQKLYDGEEFTVEW